MNYKERDDILVRDGIISPDECEELIAVHESEIHGGYIDYLTVTRLSDLALPSAIHLTVPLIRARHQILEMAEEYFGMHMELLPEFTAITGWHVGSYLNNHYDANRDYLEQRVVSALLYLNDGSDADMSSDVCGDFVGGDLVFEKSEIAPELRVRPKAGRLVCFKSSSENVHRVERITGGPRIRYSLTLWFTTIDMSELAEIDPCGFLSDSGGSLERKNSSLRLDENISPPQPWETSEQVEELWNRTLMIANLPSMDDKVINIVREAYCSYNNNGTLSNRKLRHLIAYCRWKRNCGLGHLLKNEIRELIEEWNAYVRQMIRTLEFAIVHWKENGAVTGITAEDTKKASEITFSESTSVPNHHIQR